MFANHGLMISNNSIMSSPNPERLWVLILAGISYSAAADTSGLTMQNPFFVGLSLNLEMRMADIKIPTYRASREERLDR
jgi:hypothetical protein